jgi:hypothetical protein
MKKFILFSFSLVAFSSFASVETEANKVNGNPEKGDSLTTEKPVKEPSFFDTANVYTLDWNNNVTFWYPQFNYSDSSILNFTDSTLSSHHKGIDISLKTGDTVVSAFDGKVRYAKYNSGGFGYLVIVRHVNGLETYYAHLSKLKVKPNQVVKAGELIGLGGSTGRSYSPHLHFEVRYNHHAFDPEKIFDLENFCLKQEEAMVCDLVSKSRGSNKGHAHGKSEISTANLKTGTVYSIKSGDSLGKIARKYGTSVSTLCRLNGISQNTILQIGQKIRVK